MADLVRDHIGLGEFARLAAAAAEARLHIVEERGVEIDALVGRAIKRTHRRLREAAAALLAAAIEPQVRRAILPSRAGKNFAPGILGIAEHGGNEIAGVVARPAGAPGVRLDRAAGNASRCR